MSNTEKYANEKTQRGQNKAKMLKLLRENAAKEGKKEELDRSKPLWERQEKESAKAYEAFELYLQQHPTTRTQARVNEMLGKKSSQVSNWSTRWSWVERADVWDRHNEEIRRQAFIAESKKMAERHARSAQVYISALIQPAMAILKKVQDDPEWLGNLFERNPGKAMDVLAKLSKALPVVINVERMARGQPIGITEERTVTEDTITRDEIMRSIENEEDARAINAVFDRLRAVS